MGYKRKKRQADKHVKAIRSARAARTEAAKLTTNASTGIQRAEAHRKTALAAEATRKAKLEAEYFTGARKPWYKRK